MGVDGEEVVLQHGSILLGPDHRRIVDFLNLPDEETREDMRDELRGRTTDLSAATGRRVAFDDVEQALRRGFEVSWGIRFEEVRTPAGIGTPEAASIQDFTGSVVG